MNKHINVALIYPEVYDLARYKEKRKEFPPFGVMYLASILEENSINVTIFKSVEYGKQFNFRDYDLIGFSIPSSATYNLMKNMRLNGLFSKDSIIAVGGVHPTFYPKETLVDFNADIVGVGNCEKTIVEIVEACKNKDFSQIKGACYRHGQDIITNPEQPLENNLDWLPFPARHLLHESDFIMNDRLAETETRMTHVMLSRGCPFSCHFCAVMQKKIQYRSGANVRMELEHLKRKYGIEGFAIVDDNFVVNGKHVKNICQAIQDMELRWSALSRVDTVNYEILETMKESGCIEIKFGIESGSERMLQAMGKNISCNQIRQALTLAHAVGIRIKIFFVHGFPGENMTSTRETISLLKDLRNMIDRVSLFRFAPLPGSYVFRNAELFDLNIPEHVNDWSKFHIYHNNAHWWGNKDDFKQVQESHDELARFIADQWS